MDFQALLEHYRNAVDTGIGDFLPASDERPARLHAAMRYCMKSGGKRLRPILVLAGHALGNSEFDPIPAAVAVECLHAYSLIHDDLPCIDDSDFRHNRPACHIKFGEAIAVLTGDALLTHAFFLLSSAYGGEPSLAAALALDLSYAAGTRKLIGGQMEDISTDGDATDPARLEYIHENKTAALVSASLKMGVRLSGQSPGDIENAAETGRLLGLAFQLVDDILDATGDADALGKPTGQDARNETMSAVKVLGIDEARRRVGEYTERAVETCRRMTGDTRFLVSLVKALEHRVR